MTNPGVELKGTKAVIAAVGGTATAVLTWVAAVAVVAADDKIDLGEVSSVALATAALIGTVVAVWKVPNKPKDPVA